MASGSFYTEWSNYSPKYRLTIEWNSTANKDTNSSVVTVKAKMYIPQSLSVSKRYSNTITINGVAYDFTAPAINTSGGTTVTLATVTSGAIAHNTNGKKSISISCSYRFNATLRGTYYGTQSVSKTVALDNIPKGAVIVSAPNFTDEDDPVLSYYNELGNEVDTLQACISFTGAAADVPYRDISKTGTTYAFELTDAERETLRNGTTTANSRTVYFYIRTVVDGNIYLNKIAKTLTVVNGTPTLAPTATDTNADTIALTGDSNTFVKYFSTAAVSTGAAARKGATLTAQKITCGAKTITSASGSIANVESGVFEFSATDSRGNTVTQTLTKNFVDYVKLTCNLQATAPTTSGEMTLTITGNVFKGSFGAVANGLTMQYGISENGGDMVWHDLSGTLTFNGAQYSYTHEITGLNYLNSYTLQVVAADKLMTVNSNTVKVKTVSVYDWSDGDFNFNVPVGFANVENAATTKANTALAVCAKSTADLLELTAGTLTKVPLNYFYTETNGDFTINSTGGVVCPYDGVVLVSGNIYYRAHGGTYACFVYKNSAEVVSQTLSDTNAWRSVTSGVTVIPVESGDIIYLYARSVGGAGTVTSSNTSTQLNIMYI